MMMIIDDTLNTLGQLQNLSLQDAERLKAEAEKAALAPGVWGAFLNYIRKGWWCHVDHLLHKGYPFAPAPF